jgi:hypothetical protein
MAPHNFFQVVNSAYAMEQEKSVNTERRLLNFTSPQVYLESFAGKPKILFIGAGLAYDDLVEGSKANFTNGIDLLKTRTKYYPDNAYLVDFDNKFFYGEGIPSYSDLQADITKQIGEPEGLPKEFIGAFDAIILENVSFDSMTGLAFKNLWSLLGENGKIIEKIISNAYLEVRVIDPVTNKDLIEEYQTSGLLDSNNNALAVSFSPHYWVDTDEESLISHYTYMVSPIQSEEDEAYKALKEQYKTNGFLISYENLEELYKEETYKENLFKGVFEVYKYNLCEYFKKLIPSSKVSFSYMEDLWVTTVPKEGYFVVTK